MLLTAIGRYLFTLFESYCRQILVPGATCEHIYHCYSVDTCSFSTYVTSKVARHKVVGCFKE